MLKAGSKRRRTKQEIENEEQAKLDHENDVRSKMARLDQLEQQMAQVQQQADENRGAAVLMSDLVNAGVIKQKAENSYVVTATTASSTSTTSRDDSRGAE